MKLTVIKAKDQERTVSINTETLADKADDAFDSKEFDSIPAERIQRVFVDKYRTHSKAILELVVSRMALSTALSNVEASIKEAMEDAIVVDTDVTRESLDSGYTLALLAHGYNEAFSFLTDEEMRKDIILTLLTGKRLKGGNSKKSPVGYVKGNELENEIDEIRNAVEGKLEKDNDPIYGNLANRKVGVIGRRNQK